jgi:hypothetical protein
MIIAVMHAFFLTGFDGIAINLRCAGDKSFCKMAQTAA